MSVLASGFSWVDLHFQGRPHAIATGVIRDGDSVGLVNPGPTTCLAALEAGLQQQGLRLEAVTDILLTHIHLDHAGATGTLLQRVPRARVFVHERGAPHLISPEKLLASAARLYGNQMDRLWGEFASVPEENLSVLAGGERIEVGGRTFEVVYTPGHASHHVSYFDASSGVAFVGDTAGICVDGGYVLPPTPPPDIDVELWKESIARLEAWSPQTIFLTHFGPVEPLRPHLRMLVANLEAAAALVRRLLDEPGTDDEKSRRFAAEVRRELQRHQGDVQLDAYELAAPFDLLWLGLVRYWRKRSA